MNNNLFQRYLRNGKDPYGFFIADFDTGAYGYSLCSPRDKFNKKLARQVAIGRMQTDKNNLGDAITDKMLWDATVEHATHKRALLRVILHAKEIMRRPIEVEGE